MRLQSKRGPTRRKFRLTCDVGTADADGCVEIEGASEGALVGQIDTLGSRDLRECEVQHTSIQFRGGKLSRFLTWDAQMANPMAPDSGRQKAGSSESQKAQKTGCYSARRMGQCLVIRLAQLTGSH